MRVWSRRSRVALDLMESCTASPEYEELRLRVRRAARTLGRARDLDVMIETVSNQMVSLSGEQLSGARQFLNGLHSRRRAAQASVVKALDRLEQADVLGRFNRIFAGRAGANSPTTDRSGSSRPLLAVAAEMIEARLDEMLEWEPHLAFADHAREHHDLRKAAKRLRYAMEIFAPVYATYTTLGQQFAGALECIQEVQWRMGRIHDLDVLVPEVMAYPNLAGLVECLHNARNEEFARFLQFWDRLRKDRIFDSLRSTLQAAGK